jgi:hypothetical protein
LHGTALAAQRIDDQRIALAASCSTAIQHLVFGRREELGLLRCRVQMMGASFITRILRRQHDDADRRVGRCVADARSQ